MTPADSGCFYVRSMRISLNLRGFPSISRVIRLALLSFVTGRKVHEESGGRRTDQADTGRQFSDTSSQ